MLNLKSTRSLKIIFASLICAFGVNSFAQQTCSNPNQKIPSNDNYWEMKIAQGFNEVDTIKKLDEKFCFDYGRQDNNFSSFLFQMMSPEQTTFFFKRIPKYKEYRNKDRANDILMHYLLFPYINYDEGEDSKERILSIYKRIHPEATDAIFKKEHNFWVNPKMLKSNLSELKRMMDYGNSFLPYYSKNDLTKKDMFGNNALHVAAITKNYKVMDHFLPTGLELLKKNDLGANVWHYAFFPAPDILPAIYVKEQQTLMNRYLLNNFKPTHFRFMTLGNPNNPHNPNVYSPEVFFYYFRNNNIELYNALKKAHPSLFTMSEERLKEYVFDPNVIVKTFGFLGDMEDYKVKVDKKNTPLTNIQK